jgi:hypothetical protein
VDDEGDGDAVCEGDGEGEPERDALGDFDLSGEGAGEVATMRGGLVWTGVGT